jgi:hypothetical protein
MNIITQPNKTAEWYELIKETQTHTGIYFEDNIENYLVLTLSQFMKEVHIVGPPIAIDYLKSLKRPSSIANQKLRKVGDRCLLISGLFPEHADKINVSVTYFIEIGQQAYITLSERVNVKLDPKLFYELGLQFIDIKEVLSAMRRISDHRIKH